MQYGNLNKNLQCIMSKIVQSDDLLKFLFYKDMGEGVASLSNVSGKDKVGMITGKTQQIFPYKKIPQSREEFQCYISMEYGAVNRETRGRGSKYFKYPSFFIYILVSQTLDSTPNGSRLLAIEQCIEDTFHGKQIDAISMCYLGNSTPIDCPNGYLGRAIPLIFVDTNEVSLNG